jgi:hypothetical protein
MADLLSLIAGRHLVWAWHLRFSHRQAQNVEICFCAKFETNRWMQKEVITALASIGLFGWRNSPKNLGFGALLPVNNCFSYKTKFCILMYSSKSTVLH